MKSKIWFLRRSECFTPPRGVQHSKHKIKILDPRRQKKAPWVQDFYFILLFHLYFSFIFYTFFIGKILYLRSSFRWLKLLKPPQIICSVIIQMELHDFPRILHYSFLVHVIHFYELSSWRLGLVYSPLFSCILFLFGSFPLRPKHQG